MYPVKKLWTFPILSIYVKLYSARNLQVRANVTQRRREKLWKISDLERIGN